MNGGGGTTTTTQNSSPWIGAQPYLEDLMGKAQQTYDAAQGQNQLPPTYAGPSDTTKNALQGIVQRAQNGSPLINTADQSLSNILQPKTSPGTDALQSLISGNNPGAAYTQAGAGSNGALNAATNVLSANTGPNPYLDQMFNAESQPVIDAVNAQAGSAGRTGSGADQQLLTRNLGQLAGQVYGSNYLGEQQLGQNAASILSGIGENQAQRQLAAGGQLSSNILNAAGGLNNQFNTQNQQALTAAGFAPSLAGQDYTDLQNMLTAGGAYDTQSQNRLNSILQQFQYSQQQPWNILSGYAGSISGLGGLGGSSSGTSTQPSQSGIPGLIGTGISMLPFFL